MTQTNLLLKDSAVARCAEEGPRPRVGPWELVCLAAEGSWSRVYRARPLGAAADQPAAYAVKMLRPECEGDPRAVELLVREATVGRSVAHPHLISILGASLGRSPRLLVMPWLSGSTLRQRTSAGLSPDVPVALWVVRQVAEALDALHAAGWMHGDVKPSNIFVSPELHGTLLDLGFARRCDGTVSTLDPVVTGTCQYLAPECITSALAPDIRSDIYSLGVVLYEWFAGRLPFQSASLAELATQHKQATPPDLQRLAPYVPLDVVRLVRQMLAKDPLRRPQTPRELIERLTTLEIATFSERVLAS